MKNKKTQDLNENLLKTLSNDASNFSAAKTLENVLELLMEAERKLHLQENQTDKGNGYYSRKLGTPLGKLNINVPRDRDGNFRPKVLPSKYSRDTKERFDVLKSLLKASYSKSSISKIFKDLGLSYSSTELNKLKELYLNEFNSWNNRELPQDVIGLFIDAYIDRGKF